VGVIKFVPSDEVPEPSSNKRAYFNKLYTTNWRVMTAGKTTNKLTVSMHNFRTFEIYDMTVNEFLANNFTRGTVERSFKYQINLLSCSICHGEGRVDWIQKAVNRDAEMPREAYRYRRNPDHVSKFEPLHKHKDIADVIYGSIPSLSGGYELCSNCKGTGVNSVRPLKHLE